MGDLARIILALLILCSIAPQNWKQTLGELINLGFAVLITWFLIQSIWRLIAPRRHK